MLERLLRTGVFLGIVFAQSVMDYPILSPVYVQYRSVLGSIDLLKYPKAV